MTEGWPQSGQEYDNEKIAGTSGHGDEEGADAPVYVR
jgi:hypothetical protein